MNYQNIIFQIENGIAQLTVRSNQAPRASIWASRSKPTTRHWS